MQTRYLVIPFALAILVGMTPYKAVRVKCSDDAAEAGWK